jgi:hypothetical protein
MIANVCSMIDKEKKGRLLATNATSRTSATSG